MDGHALQDYTLDSLRQQISIVLQDVFLFYGTVKENILFGRSDASEAEIVAAAKMANAHDFIMELPEGYDTVIGERGVKLSGRSKAAHLDRASLMRNAPILILDRGYFLRGYRDGVAHPTGFGALDEGTHYHHHCAPPLNHSQR